MNPEWHDFTDAKVGDYCWLYELGDGVITEVTKRGLIAKFRNLDWSDFMFISYRLDGSMVSERHNVIKLFKQKMKWVQA